MWELHERSEYDRQRMSTEARELHRIISASVHDMLDAYLWEVGGPDSDE
jgi:hypothetical protein